jgi:hypothetical protein
MDNAIRILLYLSIGSGLLSANLWFIHTVQKALFGGELVIGTFQIIGKDGDNTKLGNAMAYMLEAQLGEIRQDMEASQNSLIKAQVSTSESQDKAISPIAFFPPKSLKQVSIPTELFEPLSVKVAVGGVEVGGILSWLQRWMVSERALNFAVYYEGDKAIVTGNLGAFGRSRNDTFKIETKATPDEITRNIAYVLIHKKLSEEPNSKVGALSRDEFRTLLEILRDAAESNRKIELGRPQNKEFQDLFSKSDRLVTQIRIKDWYELIYLTANLAESAENYDKALEFYKQIQKLSQESGQKITWLKPQMLDGKIEKLRGKATVRIRETQEEAAKAIGEDAAYAVNFLNALFKFNLSIPPIKILDKNERNAYWDGEHYNAPPQVQYLHDVTYQQNAYPFIERTVKFENQGQSGALHISYGDIFATLIKQERLKQTAQTADWTIAPGGVAWIRQEDILNSKDRSALRSLKAPGTAYNDSLLGKDPQPAHFKNIYKGSNDNGGTHINGGIPNKSFYETAIRIGSDKAGKIWYKALLKLKPKSQFQDAATATYQEAGILYGNNSAEQQVVKAAWEIVGLTPVQ